MSYTVRPLSDRSWMRPALRRPSQFKAKWSQTETLLLSEIALLSGREVVIGIDVAESDLRLDGRLRANARPASPAVEVAFESKHGSLLYRCDRFRASYYDQGPDWQHNARAIALTLQSLRAVDRYAASQSGEQYRGYRQIGAAPAEVPLAADEAWAVLRGLAGSLPADTDASPERVISLARRSAHPDHGGTRETWAAFDRAYKVVRP